MLLRVLSFCLSFLLISMPAVSCPCGCGSHSPLELTVIDQFKYRLSGSREFSPSAYQSSGKRSSEDLKVQSIDSFEVAGVYALSPYLASSLQLGFKKNSSERASSYSLADPTLGLAWAFYQENFSVIQMNLKSSFTLKAPYGSFNADEELANFSNGYWESTFGFQALFTYFNWSLILGDQLVKRHNKENIDPGLVNKLSLSLARSFIGKGQVMVGFQQELRGSDRVNGLVLSKSSIARLGHSFLWSLQKRVGDRKNLELAGNHPLPWQKNSIAYHQLSLSFSQTV